MMAMDDRADKGALSMSHPFPVVGIDICGDHLDIHDAATGKDRRRRHDRSGVQALVGDLVEQQKRGGPVLVVMEATGGLERTLRGALDAAGIACHVANPKRIRDYARGVGWLAKTDRIDATLLARFGTNEKPAPTRPLDPARQEMRDMLAYRAQIQHEITARQAQLKHFQPAMAVRAAMAISRLKADLKEIDADVRTAAKKAELHAITKRLTTCPGVGILTASMLAAYMPELGQLDARQAASLAGLAPIARDSGNMRGIRTIQGGRANLRKALYMAALVASTHNPAIKAFYQRLITAGKRPKVALTACMRKLITILNAMIKTEKDWTHRHN